uniref:EF-hand domain-containing protein n=1 Tax=Oryza rufipogon TaxID=4529 RepID=A0A0E0QPB5_ORYRU
MYEHTGESPTVSDRSRGSITTKELKTGHDVYILWSMEAMLQDIISKVDSDGNDNIDFHEFLA